MIISLSPSYHCSSLVGLPFCFVDIEQPVGYSERAFGGLEMMFYLLVVNVRIVSLLMVGENRSNLRPQSYRRSFCRLS